MLFDSIVTETDREAMRKVFARRVQYLRNRAHQLAERRQPEGAIDDWQTAMMQASLHLEVAEGAAALGKIDDARSAISSAASNFVQLGMPFGAALKRAFVADHGALAAQTDKLMHEWRAILGWRKPGEPGKGADPTLAPHAVDTPQQWAYYGLSEALTRESDPADESRAAPDNALFGWKLVPVGRMRFPMDHYLCIIRYCEVARRPQEDIGGQARFVVEILAKQLVALLRALQYASMNHYLWSRVLAPAPWFDLDVALLIAAVLAAPGELSHNLDQALVKEVPSDVSQYAKEYVAVVTELMPAR